MEIPLAVRSSEPPPDERELLVLILEIAADLASAGKLGAGYTCLVAGLHRAEALERDGRPYGEALAARYQALAEGYGRRYAVLRQTPVGRTEGR
jgi:hypothetical protein